MFFVVVVVVVAVKVLQPEAAEKLDKFVQRLKECLQLSQPFVLVRLSYFFSFVQKSVVTEGSIESGACQYLRHHLITAKEAHCMLYQNLSAVSKGNQRWKGKADDVRSTCSCQTKSVSLLTETAL